MVSPNKLQKRFRKPMFSLTQRPPPPDDTDLSDVDLPPRTKGALLEANVQTLSELATWTKEKLLSLDGVAKGGVKRVREVLDDHGFGLSE